MMVGVRWYGKMRRRTPRWCGYAAVVVWGLSIVTVWAQDDQTMDTANCVALLDQAASHVVDLQADFTQLKQTPLLARPLESHGQVRLTRDISRWDTRVPASSMMVHTRRQIRIYYPDLKTMEVIDLDRAVPQATIGPLPNWSAIQREFVLTRVPSDGDGHGLDTGQGDRVVLRLLPNDETLGQYLTQCTVAVDLATGLVHQAAYVTTDGEQTMITFSEHRVNSGLRAGDLELSLPEDVQVVRPTGGME